MHLACKDPDRYVYIEGYATSAEVTSLTASHAWCYDRKTGLIVDPTWKDGVDYVGVPIRTPYTCEAILKYNYAGSLIEDREHGYPLITGAAPREAWEERL